ncbi:ribosome biogenesis GTPase YlqF [Mycoplasmopsis adleri]|uniref:ribosome biogenesis GTPase YlqF n=1 Tax=Mycoplasmopsis adleri TaxID=51362 RepID=UPI003873B7D2
MEQKEEQLLINWYPGHMAKALKEIKENANIADIFLIVLDARCPISSYNEDFNAIAPQKPRLFIITKSDLMDKSKKDMIQKRFGNETLLWLDLRNPKSKKIILEKINKLLKAKIDRDKAKGLLVSRIKVFVMGVPNAGKSTLINLMSGKKSLKVANYPGVTRDKKWVAVDNIFFMDTPGILLPKLSDQEAAAKLAMIGSIETKIFPQKFLFENFLKIMAKYYPEKLIETFHIDPKDLENLDEYKTHNIIVHIANEFGFKQNNKIEFNKVYTFFLNWIKNLKNITLD